MAVENVPYVYARGWRGGGGGVKRVESLARQDGLPADRTSLSWPSIETIGSSVTTRVFTTHVPLDIDEERHRLTMDALADVDAGRMIGHQAVQAWADSLSTDSRYRPPAS